MPLTSTSSWIKAWNHLIPSPYSTVKQTIIAQLTCCHLWRQINSSDQQERLSRNLVLQPQWGQEFVLSTPTLTPIIWCPFWPLECFGQKPSFQLGENALCSLGFEITMYSFKLRIVIECIQVFDIDNRLFKDERCETHQAISAPQLDSVFS